MAQHKNKRFYGSINFDALLSAIKNEKVKTYKNEKARFVNINVWINTEPDQYDNDGAIQLQLKEDFKDEKSVYIGNLREAKPKITEATPKDFEQEAEDDLPF